MNTVDTPNFKPARGGSFELLSSETYEKYKDYEIVYGESGGTRLNNLAKKARVTCLRSQSYQEPPNSLSRISKSYRISNSHGKTIPKIQATNFHEETPEENETRLQRLKFVKDMFLISWNQYKKYAWGKNEVKPVSLKAFDPFAGWAATLVDALDTLVIMDLKEEFKESCGPC